VFHAVQRCRRLAALSAYQGQKGLLEESFAKNGKDYFVASYSLFQRPDGAHFSQSVWSKGVATLLPVTDEVHLFDPDLPEGKQILGSVPWARVMAVAGDLMLDTAMFPQRFYVSKFPSPDQLKALLSGAA
jgi:hypothetical protein